MSIVNNEIREYLTSLYGKSLERKYEEFIKREPSVYLRVNSLKTNKLDLINSLKKQYGVVCKEIENIPNALKVIEGEKIVGKTLQHVTGKFYIQGLSSMIPPLVLSPASDDKVLDLCAAPGSKTTELGEMMNNTGTLIANEIKQSRVSTLVYNIDRINLVNTAVTHNRGEWLSRYFPGYFDKILVDAPCSGLGIIHKKDEVNDWWSLERAESLGELQFRLLISAIKMAKVGGEIVYSTCTLTPEENEIVLNKILEIYPVEVCRIKLPVESHPGLTEYKGLNLNPSLSLARRILPWENDSDGFFIIKLIKTDVTNFPERVKIRIKSQVLSPNSQKSKSYLSNIYGDFGIDKKVMNKFKFTLNDNNIFFINKNFDIDNLDIFHRFGVRFGKVDKHSNTILHTQAAEILEKYIIRNIYELRSLNELKTYIEGGTIKNVVIQGRQCVVKYKGNILGTAAITKNGLKSRFPRAKRTQNILIKE
ncbi:MAG TPA: RsmB/NOP family class I SAM-dependent RNA methyltransferase [Ignavibacteria bacterium]|nr:RsmB/NOP family class I SAM-dependent RNA methyltransferase [Ignavibacteria bacterium]